MSVLSVPHRHLRADVCFWQAVENHSREFAACPAIIEPGRRQLTYAELWRKVLAVESALSALQIQPGDCIATILPNGAGSLAAMLGVSRCCACAPVNPSLSGAALEEILRRLRPAAIVLLDEAHSAKHGSVAAKLGVPVLDVRELLDAPAVTMIRKKPRALLTRMKVSAPLSAKGDSRTAFILATSATTGQAKLVTHSLASLNAFSSTVSDALQLSSGDRGLLLCPAHHMLGLSSALAQWMAGGAVIAPSDFAAGAFSQWVNEFSITWYAALPATHRAVLHQVCTDPLRGDSTLRFVCSSGTPLPPSLAEELSEALCAAVIDTYGLTETGPLASSIVADYPPIPSIAGSRPASVAFTGKSIGPEVAIMGPDRNLLGVGQLGEIVLLGGANSNGYLDDPQGTAGAFHQGWFRTGDLGKMDAAKNLFVLGRLNEVIQRDGEMILPIEVEEVLNSHPSVLKSVAFALPHLETGEVLACAVELREGAVADADGLRGYALEKLTHNRVPCHVFFIDEVPHTLNGKPQRVLVAEIVRRAQQAADQDHWEA